MNPVRKYSSTEICNHELLKYVLQTPSVLVAEQIFHYIRRLDTLVRVEVERPEPSTS